MSKIFISHNSKDANKINELVKSLKILKKEVFYSSKASTNTIDCGQDFYEKIKEEISNSEVVLFMVSDNFYNSIPSLIEVGMAYSLGKKMIPIGLSGGNYKNLLKGVFNTNQKLICLDNKSDIGNLLSSLVPNPKFSEINDLVDAIVLSINNIEVQDNTDKAGFGCENAITVEPSENNFDIDKIKSKSNPICIDKDMLQEFDYIFIKYMVETRTYKFGFENDYNYWASKFSRWVKSNNLDIDGCDDRFLNLLERLELFEDNNGDLKVVKDGIAIIEDIYKIDVENINLAIENNLKYDDSQFVPF